MIRIDPDLRALVDALQQREYVAHVEPEERISRVGLLNDEDASRSQDAPDLAACSRLAVRRWQMMQYPDREHVV